MLSRALIFTEAQVVPTSLRRWDITREHNPAIWPYDLAWHGLALKPDAAACRLVAARLIGFALQRRKPAAPLPATVTATMTEPTMRTASVATWTLSPGVTLVLELPSASELAFRIRLDADNGWFTLYPRIAERWASALLTIAALLDDAHAYVATVLSQRWAGHTVEARLNLFLDAAEPDLTPEQQRFADKVRQVLADEHDAAQTDLITAAFDVANPDLPCALNDLVHGGTLDHCDAAEVIRRLAGRYRIPIFVLSAAHTEIRAALARNSAGGDRLTEAQWRRLANTEHVRDLPDRIEHEVSSGLLMTEVETALLQAGVVCRGPVDAPRACPERLEDGVDVTWGRCAGHRPATLASAIAAPCPTGWGSEEHDDDGTGVCAVCSMPLTEHGFVAVAEPDEYDLAAVVEPDEHAPDTV